MKQIIIILLVALSYLYVEAKDSTTIERAITKKYTTQVDTIKFVNDTAWIAEKPKVSHIVYADNSSSSNFIGEYIFPIFMLLLGIGIDRFIIWRSDKKKIRTTAKRWMAELRVSQTHISKQQKSLMSFISTYCDITDAMEIPNIAVYSGANGARFNALAKEDLYEYLENKKGVDCNVVFDKICSIIFTLELTQKQLVDQLAEFRSNGSKLIEQYNLNIQQYRTHLFDVLSHSGDDGMKREDAKKLSDIYAIVFQEEGRLCNVFRSKEEFINPSIKILTKYKTNEITIQMIHILTTCSDIIVEMKNEKIYIKKNFEHCYNIYVDTVLAVKYVLEQLGKN